MRRFVFLLCIVGVTLAIDKVLRFRPDGTFKVVQFTDLHYGEEPEKDVNSTRVQEGVLNIEKPDIVTLTGDMVSGYAWPGTSGWYKQMWYKWTKAMVDLKYRWAYALGNHDDQADLNRREIVQLDMSAIYSLTQQGPTAITGATNYYLPVMSSNGSEIIAILWFFDSGDNNCLGVEGWDCVHPDAVEWYRDTSRLLSTKAGKTIPGLAFFHIPLPEYMSVWNYNTCYGKLDDEGVCCFSVNSGLYAAMKQQGDMVATFVGHDHDNDYFGDFHNITLYYGRKSGYGGYGPPPGWLRGARIIELQEKPFGIKSWIRQEDGSKVVRQPVHKPGAQMQYLCCDSVGKESPSDRFAREFRAQMRPIST